MSGVSSITIILSEGVYAIGETTLFKPEHWSFSRDERLTIRAQVLPDDLEWHIGHMPTLIHTMPLPIPPMWNGNPDLLGGAVNGMVIETSHVTIQGLKFLGLPVVETPQPGLKRRMYAIGLFDPDLEVAQRLFAGNEIVAPPHVGIIARGNCLVVHHCIFYGFMKDAVFSGQARVPTMSCGTASFMAPMILPDRHKHPIPNIVLHHRKWPSSDSTTSICGNSRRAGGTARLLAFWADHGGG